MVTPPQQNFQPQTRDTTNGPHVHTYIPRSDGTILVGGIAYVPQTLGDTVAATTVQVGAVPVAIQPATVQLPTVQLPPEYLQAPLSYPYAMYPGVPSVVYQQPGMIAQPQPVYSPYSYAQQPYIIQQQPSVAGLPNFSIMQPSYGTYGQTGSEVLAQQMAYAQASNVNEKQEMKPADDDPFRMYWVREHDGSWTQRNRMTIDSGDIGDCRWYAMDGQFYAVRLNTG